MSKQTLKPGWKRVKFGDVVRLNTDRCADPATAGIERYIGLEHIEPEDLRIRRWGLVAEGTTFTNRFQPGQVLFGKRRAYQRKVAVADFEGVCSGDIYVFEPKDERLLPELLPFLCQTERFFEYAVGTSAGSLSPRTNWTQLANYEFALPPLEEQQRIVELLQEYESVIEAYNAAETALETLRLALVDNQIAATDTVVPFDTLLLDTAYGCSSKSGNEPIGTPILRIPNVLRGELDFSDLQWLHLSNKELERYLVKAGDILIVRTNGNPDYVGRCVVVPSLETPMVYASYLIRLRICAEKVLPEFIATLLNAPSLRRKLRGDIRSSAGNYNLNTEGIRRQMIPILSLQEQQEFVEHLAQIKLAKQRLQQRYEAAGAMKKAILMQMETYYV